MAEDNSRLTECNDDAGLAVERVSNDGVDINAERQIMITQFCCRRVVHPQVSIFRPSLILGRTLMPKGEKPKKHN